jgi:hypothetical protein
MHLPAESSIVQKAARTPLAPLRLHSVHRQSRQPLTLN